MNIGQHWMASILYICLFATTVDPGHSGLDLTRVRIRIRETGASNSIAEFQFNIKNG